MKRALSRVTATLRDLGGVDEPTAAAAGAAAGDAVRVQQLGFSIDDDSAVRAQARADAVRQAQDQAKQMADAAGVRLGPDLPRQRARPLTRSAMPGNSAAE